MAQAAIVVGVAVGMAALQASQQNKAAREQQRISDSSTALNLESQKTASADRQAMLARQFRQKMAEQIALTSMRGGSSSLAAQFATGSYQNFNADMRALQNQQRTAETQALLNYESTAQRVRATRMAGYTNMISAGVNAYAGSAFGNTGATSAAAGAQAPSGVASGSAARGAVVPGRVFGG